MKSSRLPLIAMAVVSSAGTLIAVEGAMRYLAFRAEARTIAALATSERPQVAPGSRVDMRDIIVPSLYHDIVFKLQPNLRDVSFCRSRLSTNRFGFRGRDFERAKEPGVVRVVGLGDSVMFGWGVHDGEEYLAQLAARLELEYPDRRYEFINTAVPGYNTHMEVAVLEKRALDLDPDIVIYGYCVNDEELPRFLRPKQDHLTLRRSYLWDLLRERRFTWSRGSRNDLMGLVDAPKKNKRHWRGFATDPALVPPEYAHMVGPRAFEASLDRLAALSRERGFRVVVLVHPPTPEGVVELFRARGFGVVDTQPYLDRYLADGGHASLAASPLIVGQPCHGKGLDYHPSAVGHQLIAEALRDGLREMGVLPEPEVAQDPSRHAADEPSQPDPGPA